MAFWAQTDTITVAWLEMGMDSPMNTMEKINFEATVSSAS
jgi:hypothetical protein